MPSKHMHKQAYAKQCLYITCKLQNYYIIFIKDYNSIRSTPWAVLSNICSEVKATEQPRMVFFKNVTFSYFATYLTNNGVQNILKYTFQYIR